MASMRSYAHDDTLGVVCRVIPPYAGGAQRDELGREVGDRKGARKVGAEEMRGRDVGTLGLSRLGIESARCWSRRLSLLPLLVTL